MTRSLAPFIMLAIVATPAVLRAAQPPVTDAEAIFERARTTWSNMSYPSLLDYRIAVHFIAGGATHVEHYTGEVEPASGECRVHAFSDEEAEHPTTPHGINVMLTFGLGGSTAFSTILNPAPKPVSFGMPDLSPLYSFGMRTGKRLTDDDEPATLKTIGRVITLARHYDVQFVERTSLDGTDVYHLALRPLTEPDRNRLRDLWIATATFDVVGARVLGNFTDRPATTIPWMIHFTTLNDATYIASETAEAPLPNRPLLFDAVTIEFESIAPRHGSRDLLFALPDTLDVHGEVHEPAETMIRGGPDHSC
jgi:hypothetical protein